MIQDLITIVWLLLGAGMANMTPVFAANIPALKSWDTPIDFGKKLGGKPIFGKNKTWRGLMCGIIVAILTVYLQQLLLKTLDKNITINSTAFTDFSPVVLGTLLGAGALLGDAVESFFKRRAGVAPGKSWFPFDQIDYILGAALFTYPIAPLPLYQYLLLLVVGFILHLLVNYLGYLLKLKDDII